MSGAPSIERCEFGVTRGVRGRATVFIKLPDGRIRALDFQNGAVASLSEALSLNQERSGDNTLVIIDDGAERYTIPDAVIDGG